jgi:hypothetical protein
VKVKASNKKTSVLVEYFLYTLIIIETAIAAFAYKPVLRAAEIWPAGLTYFAIAYLLTFALAFVQLHRIHRARKKARAAAAPAAKLLLPAASVVTSAIVTVPAVEPAFQPSEPITALIPYRPPAAVEEGPVRTAEVSGDTVATAPAALALGLTRVQLAVILLVFLAALKIFSWALANVVRH